jgi:GntR family transcriptional regulator
MTTNALPNKPDHKTLTMATVESLRDAIHKGRFAPGSQLPSEFNLMSLLSVSRSTLREALRLLEAQGLIIRKRGLGTYVREQPITKDLSINFGITEMIVQAGMKPGTEDMGIQYKTASAAAAEALGVTETTPVIEINRVRTANDQPVVWTLDILPAALLGSSSISAQDLETTSLYALLENQFQIRIVQGISQISPVLATVETAAKLKVKRNTPLLCIAQTDFISEDRPILYSIEYHLPDSFVFLVNRRGPHW